jgi:hypothetical protein
MPANGVGRPPPSLNVRTALAAVPDPMDATGRPLVVAVNRRVDILERERSAGHISEAAYRVGRLIQQVFEVKLRSSSNWIEAGGSRDMREAQIMMLARGKVRAEQIAAFEAKLEKSVGELGMRFLRRILGERESFDHMAGQLASTRRVQAVAGRFRAYLEEIAEAWGS